MDDLDTIHAGLRPCDGDTDIDHGLQAARGLNLAADACASVTSRIQSTGLSEPSLATSCENAILVADNDRNRLRSMAEFLEQQGHCCSTARCLTSALALLRTGSYSLFVCDIRIEGHASLRLLGPLVRTSPYPPMILTAGSSKWDSAQEVFRRGATELLLTQHYLDRFRRILTSAASAGT